MQKKGFYVDVGERGKKGTKQHSIYYRNRNKQFCSSWKTDYTLGFQSQLEYDLFLVMYLMIFMKDIVSSSKLYVY